MSRWLLLALSFTLAQIAWAKSFSDTVLEEKLYYDFQKAIMSSGARPGLIPNGLSAMEQGMFVDALWDLLEDERPEALKALREIPQFHYDLDQKLRLGILRIKYLKASRLSDNLEQELLNLLQFPQVESKIIYLLAAFEAELLASGHDELIQLAQAHKEYQEISKQEKRMKSVSDIVVSDLFYDSPQVNGNIKLFVFCRQNRIYPCLMVMRNIHDEAVRLPDGKLWTQPALASSKHDLPSHQRNGDTPAGVLTIDSVMPTADRTDDFGEFRRLILDFIPKSQSEMTLKSLLPASSVSEKWWREAVVARDIGRNMLRIHGTGRINPDSESIYFPFVRTSGCIAQRENTYGEVTFKDQRKLLDAIMLAMDLEAHYDNETKIKGILYLMEIDDKDAPVTLEDLAYRGIE